MMCVCRCVCFHLILFPRRSLVISLGPHSEVEEEHAGKYRPYPVNIPLSQVRWTVMSII